MENSAGILWRPRDELTIEARNKGIGQQKLNDPFQRAKSELLQQPVFQQTKVTGPIEDNVIEQADANNLSGFFQLFCNIQIVC